MRIFLFISLFCSIAFSATVLNGAGATQTVTINHLAVSEMNGHFPYQLKIPRTGLVASNVNVADDVGFTRVNDTIRIPRWVIFTTDTIYLYGDIAVSSTVDTSYRLQYGTSLTEVNSSAAFTNSGVTNHWGCNEPSGSTVADYASGNNLTSGGSTLVGQSGLFYNAVKNTGSNSTLTSSAVTYPSLTNLTICFAIKYEGDFTTLKTIFRRNTGTDLLIYQNANTLNFRTIASGTPQGSISTTALQLNQWYHIAMVYDGSGSTNADRLKIYVDGVAKSVTYGGTIPALLDNSTSTYVWYASSSPFIGSLDELQISGISKTATSISTRYNSIFNPSAFSTVSSVRSTSTSTGLKNGLWNKVKMQFRAGFK